MKSIEKLTKKLDTEITRTYEEYIGLHKELDTHRGHTITETNLPEVNRLLKEIQERFAAIYPAYYFIATRNEHANNAVNSYNEFIESIKKAGAKQEDKPKIS